MRSTSAKISESSGAFALAPVGSEASAIATFTVAVSVPRPSERTFSAFSCSSTLLTNPSTVFLPTPPPDGPVGASLASAAAKARAAFEPIVSNSVRSSVAEPLFIAGRTVIASTSSAPRRTARPTFAPAPIPAAGGGALREPRPREPESSSLSRLRDDADFGAGATGFMTGAAAAGATGLTTGAIVGGATGLTTGAIVGGAIGRATGGMTGGMTGGLTGGTVGGTEGGTNGAIAGGATGGTVGGTNGLATGGTVGGTAGGTIGGRRGGSSPPPPPPNFRSPRPDGRSAMGLDLR